MENLASDIAYEPFAEGGLDDPYPAYRALREKYGVQMRLLDFTSWLGGRIGRRQVIRIDV